MYMRKEWIRAIGAMSWGAALGFAAPAQAAVLEPYDVTVQYRPRPGSPVASATNSWKADAPRAFGFDVRRRVSGNNDRVRVRYASERRQGTSA